MDSQIPDLNALEEDKSEFGILLMEHMTYCWFQSYENGYDKAIGVLGLVGEDSNQAARDHKFIYWKGGSIAAFLKETNCKDKTKAVALRNFEKMHERLFHDNFLFLVLKPNQLMRFWLPKDPKRFWPSQALRNKYYFAYLSEIRLE